MGRLASCTRKWALLPLMSAKFCFFSSRTLPNPTCRLHKSFIIQILESALVTSRWAQPLASGNRSFSQLVGENFIDMFCTQFWRRLAEAGNFFFFVKWPKNGRLRRPGEVVAGRWQIIVWQAPPPHTRISTLRMSTRGPVFRWTKPGRDIDYRTMDSRWLRGGSARRKGASLKVIEHEVVAALAQALCQRIGEPRYQLWFHDKTKFSWDQDRLVVGVPNRFFQEWLQRTFVQDVEETASTLMGEPVRASFVIDPQLFQTFRQQEAAERAGSGLPAGGLPGSFEPATAWPVRRGIFPRLRPSSWGHAVSSPERPGGRGR